MKWMVVWMCMLGCSCSAYAGQRNTQFWYLADMEFAQTSQTQFSIVPDSSEDPFGIHDSIPSFFYFDQFEPLVQELNELDERLARMGNPLARPMLLSSTVVLKNVYAKKRNSSLPGPISEKSWSYIDLEIEIWGHDFLAMSPSMIFSQPKKYLPMLGRMGYLQQSEIDCYLELKKMFDEEMPNSSCPLPMEAQEKRQDEIQSQIFALIETLPYIIFEPLDQKARRFRGQMSQRQMQNLFFGQSLEKKE
ncbi:MAG: hypothetical protein R3A11_08405 [Bdellovibrionota bacterium]